MQHNLTMQRRTLVPSPERPQRNTTLIATAALLAALLGSCGTIGDGAPGQEEVLSLLREEALELKAEGENLDPAFGVTANWEIEDVQVRKPANEDGPPWRGTIRFKITSRVHDPDGSTSTDEFDKNIEYLWDTELDRWTVR
jgi:hypothetical protein